MLVAAVDGQRIHGQIIGADGEKVGHFGERVGGKGRPRYLDHHTDRRQRVGEGNILAGQAPGDARNMFAHCDNFGPVGGHWQQDADRAQGPGPQNCGELGVTRSCASCWPTAAVTSCSCTVA